MGWGVEAGLLAAVCVWGWSFLATKVLLRSLDPLEVVAARMAIGLPVMALVAWRAPGRAAATAAERSRLLVCGGILLAHFLLQAWALTRTSATNTAWLVALSPLTIAGFAAALLGERLRPSQWAGVLVAMLGVLMLVSRGGQEPLRGPRSLGDWAVVASTFTWAAYTTLSRDLGRRHGAARVVAGTLAVATAGVCLALLVLRRAPELRELPPAGWAALLFLGLLAQGLAFLLWQEGVARLGASRAGLFLYLEPLATTAVAVPLFGESFGPLAALGGALVLLGVALGEGRRRAAHRT